MHKKHKNVVVCRNSKNKFSSKQQRLNQTQMLSASKKDRIARTWGWWEG